MKSKMLVLMVSALVVMPAVAQAQATSAQASGQAQAAARIDAAMQTAARAQIPVTLLQSKVAEGEAKQVPPQRIAAAVEARLTALIKASDALQRARIRGATESELAVAGDAVQAGVSEKALVKIYQNAPAERRVVAVAVLADLVRLGTQSESAVARVNAAVRTTASLASLQSEVAAQLRAGGLSSTLDATGLVRLK